MRNFQPAAVSPIPPIPNETTHLSGLQSSEHPRNSSPETCKSRRKTRSLWLCFYAGLAQLPPKFQQTSPGAKPVIQQGISANLMLCISCPKRAIPTAFRKTSRISDILCQGSIHLHIETWTATLLGLIYCHLCLYAGEESLQFQTHSDYPMSSWILIALL